MRGSIIAATVTVFALAVPASAQELQAVTFPAARIAFFDAQRGVHVVFNRLAPPIIWVDPTYDITQQIIERLDAN